MEGTLTELSTTAIILAFMLPLASAVVAAVIPSRFGWVVTLTAPVLQFTSMVMFCWLSVGFLQNQTYLSFSLPWFKLGETMISFGIQLDATTLIMLPVISIVSFLVHLYSTGYMAGDNGLKRYFAMLGFFTFAMLGLVLVNNLLLVFFFWELVGFSSYILIGHWTEKPEAGAAAKKAFIFNRVGDAGFLIALMLIWSHAGSLTLNDVSLLDGQSWQTVAALCLFAGVMGKSAQFPLMTWLPDAMEGPTPVSALIHAATMVAAGVYLLVKLFVFFTADALVVVTVIGSVTALMASLSALVQTDIKKILAYSTLSQLGLMVIAVGTASPQAAILHLFTHAFFKAALFLGAGSIIHALHHVEHQTHQHFDAQDIRNMGGLRKQMPITFITMLVAGVALCGLPFSSGFLSKDAILHGVLSWAGQDVSWRWIIVTNAFLIPALTTFYTFRLMWFTFFGASRLPVNMEKTFLVNEAPGVMRLPLILLAAASIWFVVGINPFHFDGWLYHVLNVMPETSIPMSTWFSMVWVLFALGAAYFFYRNRMVNSAQSELSKMLLSGFYVDGLIKRVVERPVQVMIMLTDRMDVKVIDRFLHGMAYAQVTLAHGIGWFDKYIIDGLVDAIATIANRIGAMARSFQGGEIQRYIFWSVLGIIIFLISMLI